MYVTTKINTFGTGTTIVFLVVDSSDSRGNRLSGVRVGSNFDGVEVVLPSNRSFIPTQGLGLGSGMIGIGSGYHRSIIVFGVGVLNFVGSEIFNGNHYLWKKALIQVNRLF